MPHNRDALFCVFVFMHLRFFLRLRFFCVFVFFLAFSFFLRLCFFFAFFFFLRLGSLKYASSFFSKNENDVNLAVASTVCMVISAF